MTSPTTRIVYTLHGPRLVDSSDPYPLGKPPAGAPVVRPLVVSTHQPWRPEDSPPYVPSISRSQLPHLSRRRSAPYTSPPPRSTQSSSSRSPSPSSSGYFRSSQNARHGCIERIKMELDAIANLDANVMIVMSEVERERDNYRSAAEAAQYQLRRVSEERDHLREQFEALSVKDNGKATRTSSSSPKEFQQRISATGPERSKSTSLSHSRHSSWTKSWLYGQPRCKSAEPWLSGPRGVNDCFDVTIVAPSLPPQPTSPRKFAVDSNLIRDASNPGEERLCYPSSNPGEISVEHLDILYEPFEGRVYCRACLLKCKNSDEVEVKTYPNNASWDELRDHWLNEHPKEGEVIARLTGAELDELRRQRRAKLQSSS